VSRTRTFDDEVVLAKAAHLFRQKGFGAVNVGDLESATGLSVGSLYNAFGSKRGIFDAALEFYNRKVLEGRLARYAPAGSGVGGLRRLFLSLLEEPGGTSFGCLLTNTAVEFGASAGACVDGGLEILAKAFESRVPRATATRLLALYQGILVLVRAGYDRAALRKAIHSDFDTLGDQS
jgi:TetR/AcrR family transcriptional regulator, transcriptional repressor for nem operon